MSAQWYDVEEDERFDGATIDGELMRRCRRCGKIMPVKSAKGHWLGAHTDKRKKQPGAVPLHQVVGQERQHPPLPVEQDIVEQHHVEPPRARPMGTDPVEAIMRKIGDEIRAQIIGLAEENRRLTAENADLRQRMSSLAALIH